jgi:hypothetical protein
VRRIIRRPSSAMVVACLALLVALGGTSVAAVSQFVPRNSVGTQQLKRNAVTAAKITPNAVRTGHVLNGSLLVEDFKAGQIPQGPKGDKGEKGEKGDNGPPGASAYEIVVASFPVASQYITTQTVSCPSGKRALGGGARSTTLSFDGPYLVNSRPTPDGAGWTASYAKATTASYTVEVYAICAVVSS